MSAIAEFHPTIPIVDLNDYHNPETQNKFINDVSNALQTIGFFAVTNTGISDAVTQRAYDASIAFFQLPEEEKAKIHNPALNGQRGYVPGETAQGQTKKDHKEFVHIGNNHNLWPESVDLESPMMELMTSLNKVGVMLQQAFAQAIGEEPDFLTKQTAEGDCLLRALHYLPNPERGTCWAGQHTDIDLFTLLPPATEEGLQVLHDGTWIPVTVPPNSVIVNGGDMLQNLTNGFFQSSVHRVVANEDRPSMERHSIVYFVHAQYESDMSPTEQCINKTGGIAHYPNTSSLDLLGTRLRELGLAGQFLKDNETQRGGLLDLVKELVDSGNAAPAVQRTWNLRNQGR